MVWKLKIMKVLVVKEKKPTDINSNFEVVRLCENILTKFWLRLKRDIGFFYDFFQIAFFKKMKVLSWKESWNLRKFGN